ncbi:MAG: pilus assembly protein TadG-related protein [Candidatus Limnocylindrales bacterium]|nr:pilus assembly protein TadG-related protein [Candidatus Limnocylindrales bacterium]
MKHLDVLRQVAPARSRRRPEVGQALVLFALSLVGLLTMTGLVVDVGGAWAQVRTEQKVADVAALAGATAEANGALRAQIIQTAIDSAVANGYTAAEVQVNIPPTSGKYGPGGAGYNPRPPGGPSGAWSDNRCLPDEYPCWIEVVINREHANSFSRVVGLNSFGVTARGVAVGGIANTVTNGASPLMFNYESVTKYGKTPTKYCDPHPSKCIPNSSWPLEAEQFAWTTYCLSPVNCNVNSAEAVAIIEGGNFQITITMDMYLGPHNNGQKTAVCHALLDQYPDGGDLSVSINDDNGNLAGFWIWHLDTANSDCEGPEGEVLSGWFVDDITDTLPLTITAGGSTPTFGKYVVRLVE